MKVQEKFMARCIQLAKNGLGTTYPNPLVGSVIVRDNTVLAEGWHHRAGEPHAEVNALDQVKDPTLLKNATLYVSLEPCSHFGRTPPCAYRIIESGIKKVVIGNTDPNPKVAGRGIKKLTEAGCDVVVGVLNEECEALNKRFFTFHRKKRPYIFLKWAQTTDGFVAPLPETRKESAPVWITHPHTRQWTHKLRTTEAAILVGANTVQQDNPALSSREWYGPNPLRVVLDRTDTLPSEAQIFNHDAETLLLTEKDYRPNSWTRAEHLDFSQAIVPQICAILHRHEVQSLIVEGGTKTLQRFIDAQCWDEALVFTGAVGFGAGVTAPSSPGTLISSRLMGKDLLHHYKNLAP